MTARTHREGAPSGAPDPRPEPFELVDALDRLSDGVRVIFALGGGDAVCPSAVSYIAVSLSDDLDRLGAEIDRLCRLAGFAPMARP